MMYKRHKFLCNRFLSILLYINIFTVFKKNIFFIEEMTENGFILF